MTRLLCYIPTPGGLTGAPRRLLTLCETLQKRGIDVYLATDEKTELFEAARKRKIPVYRVVLPDILYIRRGGLFGGNFGFRLRVLGALFRLNMFFAHTIREIGADVVWIRGAKGIAFKALGACLARRPIIWDIDYELPSRGAVRWLHLIGLSLSHTVVFQYEGAGEAIFGNKRTRSYKHKMRALIPGIELERLQLFRALRQWRDRCKVFTILQVGTICARKNQVMMVRALGESMNKGAIPPVRIWFAGGVFEEAYQAKLLGEIERLGLKEYVNFLGWRDDVQQLMSEADLLVMPSEDEGVPNAVQEAMYIGLPVIVSSAGGMPSIIEHGRTGWVLPPDEPGSWADQIIACVQNKKECLEVGKAASIYAERHFAADQWGMKYGEIVEKAVLKKGPA